MRKQNLLKLSKYSQIIAIITAMIGVNISNQVVAQTAGDVVNKMEPTHQTGYLAGIVEGLAFARWVKDKPDKTGMKCIYDWYYESDTKTRFNRVRAWLERHPDKPPGALMYVLIKKECGE